MQIQPFFYKKAIIIEVFCEIPFILRQKLVILRQTQYN